MVFYATFNNISVTSWWSVLLTEETGVPRENHQPTASIMLKLEHYRQFHITLNSLTLLTSVIRALSSSFILPSSL
jgi:hypothetical protein